MPASAAVARWSPQRFEGLRAGYFAALDDRASDATAPALAMEAALAPEVTLALQVEGAGSFATPEDRAVAGLALVYDALLLSRDVQYVGLGKIDAKRLYAEHRYATAPLETPRGLEEEGQARRRFAADLLRHAQQMRPRDGRIASWVAGAEALTEPGSTSGELGAAAKGKLLAAIDVEPTFNLWTAFIAMRHEPAGTPEGQLLFDKTSRFLAARICRDPAPGSADEKNCRSGPLAPFNTQAAVVMLGDRYLRGGEEALRGGHVAEAMPLLGTARGIYATLGDERHRAETAAWHDAPYLATRLTRLGQLVPGAPLPEPDFWRSPEHDAVYDCASCHVR